MDFMSCKRHWRQLQLLLEMHLIWSFIWEDCWNEDESKSVVHLYWIACDILTGSRLWITTHYSQDPTIKFYWFICRWMETKWSFLYKRMVVESMKINIKLWRKLSPMQRCNLIQAVYFQQIRQRRTKKSISNPLPKELIR